MKRIIIVLLAAILAVSCGKNDREIRYSSDVEIELRTTEGFGAKIESHEFNNGLGKITFKGKVTNVPESAFRGCTSLKSITLPNSITSIGDLAFDGCTSLTSITIPDSVTSIGLCAFNCCSSLTNVTIPDSVTSIGESAFYHCSSLTNVTIGNSVTSIGDWAFSSCRSLKAFYGKFASTDNRCLIVDGVLNSFAPAGLTSYTIPDSVTSIGNSAFYGCTGELMVNCNIPSASEFKYGAFYGTKFTKVTIGNSVTLIGDYAFRDCTALTSVTIPDSVTSIGSGAFSGCTSLTSVTIPNSVTSIGEGAFYKCTSLTSVYCKPITPPSLGRSAFSGANITKIYVPRNSVEAYKAAEYWSDYASDIVGYDF